MTKISLTYDRLYCKNCKSSLNKNYKIVQNRPHIINVFGILYIKLVFLPVIKLFFFRNLKPITSKSNGYNLSINRFQNVYEVYKTSAS